jgi:hypothetical protein
MNALQTLKMPELPAHPHSFTPQNIWILRNITVMNSDVVRHMEMNRSLPKETSSDSAWGACDIKCQVQTEGHPCPGPKGILGNRIIGTRVQICWLNNLILIATSSDATKHLTCISLSP